MCVVGGLSLFALWIGAWVVLSGTPERVRAWSVKETLALTARAGFSVDNILVEGRTNTDPGVLRALLNINRGDSIFAFNPAAAREVIQKVSWVKEAHVERRLPGTIYVGLLERKPMALWQDKGKIRLIDAEGVTLSDRDLAAFRNLPLVVGDHAPGHAAELLRTMEAEPVLLTRLEAVSWIGNRRWDMTLKGGLTIKLPESDVGLALRRVALAQEKDGLLDRDLTLIDVRESDRMIVRTRPGAAREYKAGFIVGKSDI